MCACVCARVCWQQSELLVGLVAGHELRSYSLPRVGMQLDFGVCLGFCAFYAIYVNNGDGRFALLLPFVVTD